MYFGNKFVRGPIEVSVRVNGKDQPIYRAADDKLYVAGTPGQVYTLHVRNLLIDRIEVINTVDGRNTLKDETGDCYKNRGLIFAGGSEGDFSGWRVNNNETRQFVFGSPDRSVAQQATGSSENVGVIGFAAWRQYKPQWTYTYNAGVPFVGAGMQSAAVASASAGEPTPRTLGTGIGATQEDRVGTTTFNRESGSPDIIVIHYDTLEALQAQGGIVTPRPPSAFPGSNVGYENYV